MYDKIKSLAVLTILLALLAAGIAAVRADGSFSEPVTGSPTNPIKGEVVESKIITSEPVTGPSGRAAIARGEVVESKIITSEPITGPSGRAAMARGEVVENRIITSEPVIGPSGQTAVAQGEVVENKTLSASTAGSVAGWTWNTKSRLTFYDYGQSEDVSGRSESSVDQTVYQLRVVGELLRNGGQVWTHPVTSCCNVTQTSTGDSPYHLGFNAFWESKGEHWLKETSSSSTEAHDSTVASKQF